MQQQPPPFMTRKGSIGSAQPPTLPFAFPVRTHGHHPGGWLGLSSGHRSHAHVGGGATATTTSPSPKQKTALPAGPPNLAARRLRALALALPCLCV